MGSDNSNEVYEMKPSSNMKALSIEPGSKDLAVSYGP